MEEITYTVVKKFGERLKLKVETDGSVTVTCGIKYTKKDIEQFVCSHKRFILSRQKQIENTQKKLSMKFCNGEKVTLFGQERSIVMNTEISSPILLEEYLYLPSGITKEKLYVFLMEELYKFISPMAEFYTEKYPYLRYSQIKIYARSTAWGTCYERDKSIRFNICLAFVPKEYLEYVVVHELCHLVEMNHSPRFWKEVESLMPDFKKRKEAGKKYSLTTILEELKNIEIGN